MGRRAPVGLQFARLLKNGLQPGPEAFSAAVMEKPLQFGIVARGLEDALVLDSRVRDGLECLGLLRERPASRADRPEMAAAELHGVDLLGAAAVHPLRLPDGQAVKIREERLLSGPACRSVAPDVLKGAVRSVDSFAQAPPKITDGKPLLMGEAQIGKRVPRIELLPHRRASVNVGRLPESERMSFLREAEALKGLSADRAELLAVFRHIPIEMVSQMRFFSGNKVILYTLLRGLRRTTTRVHDMAAVRDAASQDVHLVPHRTKCRVVTL